MAFAPLAPPHADDTRSRALHSVPPGVVAGLILSVLWILTGGIARVAIDSVFMSRLASLLGVGPLQMHAWVLPGVWSAATLLCTAAVLTTVSWLIADRARGGPGAFLVLWFGAVLASAVLGLCFDVTRAVSYLPDFGVQGLSAAVIESTPPAVYWGLITGWIPALILFRRIPAEGPRPAPLRAILTVVVSAVLLITVNALGDDAWQQQVVRETAEAQGLNEDDGAFADPQADGDPVPDTAPGVAAPVLEPGQCSPENSMLLLGGNDAATGHRAQVIHLMNFGDEPCDVEGYPDIAFADQNGHVLEVEVLPGSSFMATDTGPVRITIPAQGQASAVLGWDANATAGALVARQLYAASIPGLERGSWPVELDVVAGSSVEVTAWKLDEGATAP